VLYLCCICVVSVLYLSNFFNVIPARPPRMAEVQKMQEHFSARLESSIYYLDWMPNQVWHDSALHYLCFSRKG